MGNNLNVLEVLGAFSVMLAGFFGIAKIMLSQASKDRDADRKERQRLANAVERMAVNSEKVATSNDRIATSVDKQAEQSETRNGHLAELIMQSSESVKAIADAASEHIISSIQNVQHQNIEHQHVEREIVEGKL